MAGKTDYSKLRKKFLDRRDKADVDDRWWRPDKEPPGTHKVRILPPPDNFDAWCLEYGVHYSIGSEETGYQHITCPRLTLGQKCPICEMTRKLWRGTEADQEIARAAGARRRYVSNVLVLSSKTPNEVKLWAYGDKVWHPLNEMSVGSDGDVTPIDDPMSGVNLKVTVGVNKTEKRTFPEYTVTPWEIKTSAIPDKSVLNKLHNFVQIIHEQVKPYDEIRAILLGPATPPVTAPPPAPPKAEEQEEVVETVTGEETVEASEDENDAQVTEAPGKETRSAADLKEELVKRARAAIKKS